MTAVHQLCNLIIKRRLIKPRGGAVAASRAEGWPADAGDFFSVAIAARTPRGSRPQMARRIPPHSLRGNRTISSMQTEPDATLSALVGKSLAAERIRAQIRQIAGSPVPVLILGETGTGKELCAWAIAQLSGRQPYVAVNCATLPDTLADSELFGYERGAFTGAYRDHPGLVAEANGGILFLDEVAETSPAVQAKLLRVLESGEYRRVGGTRTRRSEFRLLAATNGDPDQLVEAGKLRADLVYRLGAVRILLPPLRERMEDVPLLVDTFLRRYRHRYGAGPAGFSSAAYEVLLQHRWPGNIRELRHVVEAAAALAGASDEADASHVVQVLKAPAHLPTVTDPRPTLAELLRQAEMRALLDALREANENRARAAEILGISEATLYRKLAKYRVSGPPPRETEGGAATAD